MKIKYILYDTKFENKFSKYLNRLIPKEKKKLQERFTIFKNDIFDKRLHTHKLKGNLKDYFAFSLNYKNRLVFKIIDKNTVCFYDIGGHDIVY